MSRGALVVYREYLGCFEEAGHLAPSDEGVVFAYSESYLQNETAHAISQALPCKSKRFLLAKRSHSLRGFCQKEGCEEI